MPLWYGDDDGVGDDICSFLGDQFVTVPLVADENKTDAKESLFDGDRIVSIFRLRQIADGDAVAAYSATDSTLPATPRAVPCREFVVIRWPQQPHLSLLDSSV
mmetsp:Transcript_34621/g.62346  ORF Transcript_34621/g.62346 Transcript_34621/m.62346 type:complete len:103 (+) Transcript_34621:362-670(+)